MCKMSTSSDEHACSLCVAPSEGNARRGVVDPSEWSYYALLICAVASAWRLENPPRRLEPMQRLTALAARVVSEKCKSFLKWWVLVHNLGQNPHFSYLF